MFFRCPLQNDLIFSRLEPVGENVHRIMSGVAESPSKAVRDGFVD